MKKTYKQFLAVCLLAGIALTGFSQVNLNINFSTDFTWKAQSATVNGGFVAVGGSNAWMFNTFNASGWPNAIAGNWAIGGVYDIAGVQDIWNTPYNDSVLLRKEFIVPVADSYTGNINSQVDNQYSLFFNGTLLGAGSYSPTPVANYNIAPALQGCVNNIVAMEALNWSGPYGAKMQINITAVNVLTTPVTTPATAISCNGFTAHWDTVVGNPDFYLLDVSTDPNFGSFYSVYQDYNVGNVTSFVLSGVPGPGPYYYRIRAQRTNAAGLRISCYSNVTTVNLVSSSPPNAGNDASVCPGSSTMLNGSGTGTVTWTPAAGLSNPNILNPVATPVATTTYTLSVDNAGCISSDNVTVSVINLPPLVLSNDTAVCPGGCVNLSVSGGDYFVWAPSPGIIDSSLQIQNVCPLVSTTYSVTSYTKGPNLIVNSNFSAGNSGFSSAYAYAFPNTTEGQYYVGPNPQLWNGGLSPCVDHTTGTGNLLQVNGSPVPNLSIWCQSVPVSPNTDYLFSTWVTTFTPTNPPVLQFSINGNPLGAAFGTSNLACNWEEFFSTWNSGINTSANICIVNQNTIAAGNDFGLDDISFAPVCIQTGTVDVTMSSLVGPAISNTGPYCAGDTIRLVSASGTPSDDWSGPAGYTATNVQQPFIPNATAAMSGVYTVTVTDPYGCIATATTSVTVNPGPPATASNTGPYCTGETIQLNAGGGTGYDWSGPAGFITVTEDPAIPSSTSLHSGVYTVKVSDGSGCFSTSTTTVVVNNLPVILANINTPVCEGAILTMVASGANQYNWTGPNGFSLLNAPATYTLTNVLPVYSGTYTVTGTDVNGCSSSNTVNVVVDPTPQPNFITDLTTGCAPLCVRFTDNSTISSSSITSWNWNVEGQAPVSGNAHTLCFNTPGLYDVTLTVTSAQGCSATVSVTDYLSVVPMPVASFTYTPQQVTETDPRVSFTNTSASASMYAWQLGDGSVSTLTNPIHLYPDTGSYCITLTAANTLGCVDTVTQCLVVLPVFAIYIPNSFTPNDDGINEIFNVYGRGIKEVKVFIFDRWGEEIFSFVDVNKGWPGTTSGGAFCQAGVYVYKAFVTDGYNQPHEYIGQVNLIR